MKISNQERFAFGILEVAMVVRDTLEYFLPPNQNVSDEQRVATYQTRKNIINHLTAERTPFYAFCQQNGLGNALDANGKPLKDKDGKEVLGHGQRLLNTMQDFIKSAYSDDSRFIRILDGKLVVDSSYFVPVLEQIIGVRETLNDVLAVVINSIEKHDAENNSEDLDPNFKKMIQVEQRYSRAVELRLISMQLNSTFMRFQRDVQRYINTLRTSTNINPATDPDFKVTNDPEVAFDNNEMGKLFGYMNFVIAHSKETDEEFKAACEAMRTKARGFTGDPKITNLQDFIREFASIFVNIIKEVQTQLSPLFSDAFNSIREVEMTMQHGQAQAAPAPTPTTDVEKAAQTLSQSSLGDADAHTTDNNGQN